MAAWTLDSALNSLRTKINDSATDKYVHLAPTDPEPNGITRVFGVSDTRLVSGTVRVFLDNEELVDLDEEWSPGDSDAEPAEYIDLVSGRITIEPPDTGAILKVSYYFQWATDDELEEFLMQGAQLLGYTGVDDASLPTKFRPATLSFAAHYFYLKMAANSAQALQAGAGGFTADNTAEHPNWMDLAKLAWETAQNELEVATQDPATGAAAPAMAFTSFSLQRYVPWT